MKIIMAALVAALVALPALLSSAPAQALTAKQYAAQGRGHYISSKGRKMMRPMHRSRYGAGPRHHRRYR